MRLLFSLFFLSLFSFSFSQNAGINNTNPLGKLTINTPAANGNLPSLLLIDSANSNAGGAVLQFRNGIDKRMGLQSHFGAAANGTDSYLTFSYGGFYTMRLRGDGILSIGTTFPYLAKAGLEVNEKVGNVVSAFGTNEAGVAIESNVPGIHFNNYNFDGSRKAMVAGYGGGVEFNYLTGSLSLYNSTGTAAAGAALATAGNKMVINKNGNVGIGVPDPQSLLHINGGIKITNNNFLEFGHGLTKEDNAGKMGYALFTPKTLDMVGAGTNQSDRRIRFWAEAATEFTGNVDVFDSLRIRHLQEPATNGNRPVTVNADGVLQTDATDIMYTTIHAAEFKAVVVGDVSSFDRILSTAGNDAETLLFKNNNTSFSGAGYFSYPLNKLPFGAKIISVNVRYISKKPENSHAPSQLKARVAVSVYRQFVDPVFGSTSIKIPIINQDEYTLSVSSFYTSSGGLNVTSTAVSNPAGYITVNHFPTSLIVWALAFNFNGTPVSSNDFQTKSFWPPNRGLSFHSVEIGYKM